MAARKGSAGRAGGLGRRATPFHVTAPLSRRGVIGRCTIICACEEDFDRRAGLARALANIVAMSELQLDPDLLATLQALETHRVEFVLVGDVANAIYAHGGFVSGVAIVPGGYGRNVERLRNALQAMNAELGIAGRPDPRGLEWWHEDLRELAPCTFMTIYADIDVDFQPAGSDGYRDLFQDADRMQLAPGAGPHVASVEDLERLAHGAAPPPYAPPALPPVALPPEPDGWPGEEIRASRARARH
jgi:hypothetical protein